MAPGRRSSSAPLLSQRTGFPVLPLRFGKQVQIVRLNRWPVRAVLFLPGGLMAASLAMNTHSLSGGGVILAIFAAIFMGLAAWISTYRKSVEFDSLSGQVRLDDGFWRVRKIQTQSLAQAQHIIVTREIFYNQTGTDRSFFAVTFHFTEGLPLIVLRTKRLDRAIALARILARASGVAAFDRVAGGKSIPIEQSAPLPASEPKNFAALYAALDHWPVMMWDGVRPGPTTLWRGVSPDQTVFYRIIYPRHLGPRVLIMIFGFIAYFWIVQASVTTMVREIQNLAHPPISAPTPEAVIQYIFGAAFLGLLIFLPVLSVLWRCVWPRSFGVLMLGSTGFYWHDPSGPTFKSVHPRQKTQHYFCDYADILDISVKKPHGDFDRVPYPFLARIASERFLAIRTKDRLLEVGCGLSVLQLTAIADEIRTRYRDP